MKRIHRRLGSGLCFQIVALLIFQTAWLAATRLIPGTGQWDWWFTRANELWVLMVPVVLLLTLINAQSFMDCSLLHGLVRLYGLSVWLLFIFSLLIFDFQNNLLFFIFFYSLSIYSIVPQLFLRNFLKRKINACRSEKHNNPV